MATTKFRTAEEIEPLPDDEYQYALASGLILEREPHTLLGSGLAFFQSGRVPADENAYPMLASDLVDDISCPSRSGPSIEEKTALYLEAWVRLIWIVDSIRRTVRVRRADGTDRLLLEQDALDGEDVLPGFRLAVSELFA